MAQEYIIYADESVKKGGHFSNFYGGALISSKDLRHIVGTLEQAKVIDNFNGEIKWQKVTENYLQKYIRLMDVFFDLIEANLIKVRIMFTQKRHIPQGLTPEQKANTYHLLYYQFIKHSFGLEYMDDVGGCMVRIYLDRMPDTKEANAQFKSFLASLQNAPQFQRAGITIKLDQIAEVDSDNHVILQYLDVVLGAIQFRLNRLHLEKDPLTGKRGRRTRAKEKLYKHILMRIQRIYPRFNIGISTGQQGGKADRWHHPYRHWLFIARNSTIQDD